MSDLVFDRKEIYVRAAGLLRKWYQKCEGGGWEVIG